MAFSPNSLALDPDTLRQLFEHIPHTVFFVKDQQGRYLTANETLVRRCGLNQLRDLQGRNVYDLFPPTLAKAYAEQDLKVLRQGVSVVDQLELHWHARDRQGWCLTSKFPLYNQQRAIIGLIGISRDYFTARDHHDTPSGIAQAFAYLEQHLGEQLSPQILADLAGLSPSRFARSIKRIFHVTPSQWIAQARLNAALRLLRETQLSIADIALSCGYYDHSAFTRAFRHLTGLTPTSFRQETAQIGPSSLA